MKFIKSKRGLVTLSAVVAVLVASVGAYAYWTTTGSGTGSATNASSNGTLVLHASFANGLTPGATEPVSYTADNSNTSDLQVGTVTAVVSIDSAHATAGCLASDYSVPSQAENQTIAHSSTGTALTNGSTITFANSALNQDACKGAIVTLTLSS
jgi:hypothetical protein